MLVEELRNRGHLVYDFRHPSGRDDRNVWESVSDRLGFGVEYQTGTLSPAEFFKMLVDKQSIIRFEEHFEAMQDADTCILLLPCGRSSHCEAGYMKGLGKRVLVYDTNKEAQPELMYRMFDDYIYEIEELFQAVEQPIPGVCRICGCTQENPCYHPEHGLCWWVEDDPRVQHCINDKSNAFK